LSIESLESREMFAADLFANAGLVLSADDADSGQPLPAVVSAVVAGDGGGANSGAGAANLRPIGGIQAPPIGPIIVDPLPPPTSVLGAVFENGVVTVTGSHLSDNLFIFAEEGMLHVREVVKEFDVISVPLAEVTGIVVNANAGDDWVSVDDKSINIPATLRGELGNDKLQGGAAGDHLFGGSGDDEILGRAGDDVIEGELGNDLLVGGDGNDIVRGGDGDDYLLGGDGNDFLFGGAGNDKMFGEGGNDFMLGEGGDDLMDGGTGDDYLDGGDGIDAIYGGDGNDQIKGGDGDDRLRGEGGNDEIQGGGGSDIIEGGVGDDYLSGGAGNDAIIGGAGNDTIFGGADQDWIAGEAGADMLSGGTGNDMLMGGAGADILDGGAGNNSVHQDRPDGYVQIGITTQAISWGDVGDFFGDIWDGIADVFNWTLEKIETIGMRVYDWASHIDDRIYRLGSDLGGGLANTLSNWPWEADFWKGLGRTVLDTVFNSLDLVGLGEAWEIAGEILKPWQRAMTSEEMSVAESVFGTSLRFDRVRLDEHSLLAWIGRTHTTGHIINSTVDISDDVMIHELVHVWQYEQEGSVYLPEAGAAQAGDGYEYGEVAGLRTAIAEGKGFASFNREQQGQIVQDYYVRITNARWMESIGTAVSRPLRDDLDVYIRFVKEVSTLSHEQLDVADPVINVGPAADPGPLDPTPASPNPPAPTPPTTASIAMGDYNGDLMVNAADYIVLRGSMGASVTPFTSADGNGDGLVDANDRAVWVANYGQRVTLPLIADPGPVASPREQSVAVDAVFAQLSLQPSRRIALSSMRVETPIDSPEIGQGQPTSLLLNTLRSANNQADRKLGEQATSNKEAMSSVTPLALDVAFASFN
jgi:Ca2+-binding RTX toxin-like protein